MSTQTHPVRQQAQHPLVAVYHWFSYAACAAVVSPFIGWWQLVRFSRSVRRQYQAVRQASLRQRYQRRLGRRFLRSCGVRPSIIVGVIESQFMRQVFLPIIGEHLLAPVLAVIILVVPVSILAGICHLIFIVIPSLW